MTIEQQCVSLDLAKRLKELGVKQDGYFFYRLYSGESQIRLERFEDRLRLTTDESYAAFAVAELGEMLPKKTVSWCTSAEPAWFCETKQWEANCPQTIADTEADARAKMLIYLIENNLLTPTV